MKNSASVLIVATMDTKGKEVKFLESCFNETGVSVLTLDGGIMGESPFPVTISRNNVAAKGGMSIEDVRQIGNEGEALSIMAKGAAECAMELYQHGDIGGAIGIGGSMGTTLATAVMRAFPIGFPKVMITTMASRNTRSFVGTKDILMLHSVCDLSGVNRITEKVLRNGALAMSGMLLNRFVFPQPSKPLVIMSTLGTTETCAKQIRYTLEARDWEVIVFHTVGSGGEAMEEIIREEDVKAVIDLSLHELVDHFFGGDYDAGPTRGSAALKKGVPTILAPGNIDFLVTGPLAMAEKHFPGRTYHVHNAAITTIRTKKRELEFIAEVISKFCNDANGPVSVLIPSGGFSVWDQKGHPFYDPEAVRLFAKVMKKELNTNIPLQIIPCNINDPQFAQAVIDNLDALLH